MIFFFYFSFGGRSGTKPPSPCLVSLGQLPLMEQPLQPPMQSFPFLFSLMMWRVTSRTAARMTMPTIIVPKAFLPSHFWVCSKIFLLVFRFYFFKRSLPPWAQVSLPGRRGRSEKRWRQRSKGQSRGRR